MKKIWTVFACLLLIAACSTTTDSTTQDDVDSTTGTLHGKTVGETRQFLGVRYAEPPTGDKRWTLPQPVADTDETLDATESGNRCPQNASGGQPSTDEDCLFLDVTTPREPSGKLPVVVWWHGGGYTQGAGSDYDAKRFAEQGNVIVVTVNYRLGMFGYLGLPGLEGSGNFGLADQLAGLRWANDNAEAFGGDPDNVTLMGESAGGFSTCAALGSPETEGLVDKAIIMSGSCEVDWPAGALYPGLPEIRPYTTLDESEQTGVGIAASLNCTGDTLQCLRNMPVGTLVEQGSAFGNGLAYGTELLPGDPATTTTDVPVIMGGTADEHRAFIGGALLADPAAVTDENYSDLIAAAFGPRAQEVEQRYPRSSFDNAALAWSTVVTDSAWSCPTLRNASRLAESADVWTYEFADATAPDVSGIAATGLPPGAAHASDLPYTFDLGGHDFLTQPGQKELSDNMIDAWSKFAHTGDPGWPRTSDASGPVWEFGNPDSTVGNYADAHQCGFWGQ
ncbi:carboxylesterase/lipase family protein [Rhodococcoides kyotonense]|uniref:Carboxylic ester hydrolase n=1 Tax=Rhodococcoides kyotonense TaxID=398843 RepID=A0A239I967_9NOCA|nr:carboxylesterase family protein [Rhodococcus kyotonensis]SNS89942.1 para-nitrobenzyl esterase [Rhodococcus kyotonensis]